MVVVTVISSLHLCQCVIVSYFPMELLLQVLPATITDRNTDTSDDTDTLTSDVSAGGDSTGDHTSSGSGYNPTRGWCHVSLALV